MSNPRPSVLETEAPPLARAQVNTRMKGCASTMRMRSERRSVSYRRTSVLPVFPASRPAACRSSSDRPDRHGYAPTLNGAVPRSFVSTKCMRAMDIDSRHSGDVVNRLSANVEHAGSACPRRRRSIPDEHDEGVPSLVGDAGGRDPPDGPAPRRASAIARQPCGQLYRLVVTLS